MSKMNLEGDFYKLKTKDMKKGGKVLADAFKHDPIWNNFFEKVENKEEKLPSFFQMPITYCKTYGGTYATSENLEGIAGFMFGKYAKMSIWRLVMSGAIGPAMKVGMDIGKKMEPFDKLLYSERINNMKDRNFIYLMIIGVDSKCQGHGKKLIKALIKKSEELNLPVYLETETENNVRLYKKFGFEMIKKIIIPDINLPMWEMIREPTD